MGCFPPWIPDSSISLQITCAQTLMAPGQRQVTPWVKALQMDAKSGFTSPCLLLTPGVAAQFAISYHLGIFLSHAQGITTALKCWQMQDWQLSMLGSCTCLKT